MSLSIEDQIAEAIENGEFDDLPGHGKPLSLEQLANDENLAHRLLVEQGFALPWIETRKDIEEDWEAARRRLKQRRDWLDRDGKRAEGSISWTAAMDEFRAETRRLNERIDDYNLSVPLSQFQRRRFDPEAELDRLKAG